MNAASSIRAGKDMIVALMYKYKRSPEANCTARNTRRPFEHQTTFLGTPPRSYSASPHSMPPVRRQLNHSLSQAVGK
jgi:hypothetical protein